MSGQLKEVRDRMKSVKSTQQITKAMKMVSASKLRKAQQAIAVMRPYADRLNRILKNILFSDDGSISTKYNELREVNHVAIVLITSNKGLCGGFNNYNIKKAQSLITEQFKDQSIKDRLTIICIGKKGLEAMQRNYPEANIIAEHVNLFSDLSFTNISATSQQIMDSFANGTYDKVMVCYSQFKNTAVQEAKSIQFLPVIKESTLIKPKRKVDYLFEPNKQELLKQLVPTILHTTFQKFVKDTFAGEHGARMTAMDSATENAEELLKSLKITYNKARQEAITKELSEIVGGAAALGG